MSLRFTSITLFPEMFQTITKEGVIARALAKNIIQLDTVFLRDFSPTKLRHVDDHPFGGGDGMVLRADITENAIHSVKTPESFIVHLTPAGQVFNAQIAKDLAQKKHIIFLCGRYAGFDHRVVAKHAHLELSIGDFVLSGGELAALCLIDSISRYVPGVLGNSASALVDSFEDGLLEAPLYTRPENFENNIVPEVLRSGDHEKIKLYRRQEQLRVTALTRPDLIQKIWNDLSLKEQKFVQEILKNSEEKD